MLRARSALPYLPIHRSASVGRSLAGRPSGDGLLANAKRVRLCCGLRLGGGSRKPQRPYKVSKKLWTSAWLACEPKKPLWTASRKASRVQDFRTCLRNLAQRKSKKI